MQDFLHDFGIWVVIIVVIWTGLMLFAVIYGLRGMSKNTAYVESYYESYQTETAVESYASEE